VRPRPARQRRCVVQVVVGQRLCGGHEAGRAVGYRSRLGRICCCHVWKDIRPGTAGLDQPGFGGSVRGMLALMDPRGQR